MPAETYLFTEQSAAILKRAGIAPFDVSVALESRPRVRRHIGGALKMLGRGRHGRWLTVALIEQADDEYEVVGARYLEPDEVEAIERYVGEERAMSERDEAIEALAARVGEGFAGEIDREPAPSSTVLSIRVPTTLAQRLFLEAERRGVKPSAAARDLLDDGLTTSETEGTVRIADVQRALNQLARRRSA
ncbi:MAG: hypothetical protein ACRDVN_10835 [Jiangellaceae bacterium]